jgi:pimeloyl-ACP methyl ester carboxylesterase
MPLNLAFFGLNRADQVMAAFPDIETWAVGGHSLGGAMAAEYVRANPEQVSGLVLWASYPGGNNDLSAADLPILSVYASKTAWPPWRISPTHGHACPSTPLLLKSAAVTMLVLAGMAPKTATARPPSANLNSKI